jgi:hypothetical protein
MASPQSNRRTKRRESVGESLGLIDRADKVAMIGAKVLVILEINGKYSIYNSQSDKLWVPLDVIKILM